MYLTIRYGSGQRLIKNGLRKEKQKAKEREPRKRKRPVVHDV